MERISFHPHVMQGEVTAAQLANGICRGPTRFQMLRNDPGQVTLTKIEIQISGTYPEEKRQVCKDMWSRFLNVVWYNNKLQRQPISWEISKYQWHIHKWVTMHATLKNDGALYLLTWRNV